MIVFLTPPDNGWATRIIQIQLPSGEQWTVTFGDGLIMVALLLLFIEVVKAARPDGRLSAQRTLTAARPDPSRRLATTRCDGPRNSSGWTLAGDRLRGQCRNMRSASTGIAAS